MQAGRSVGRYVYTLCMRVGAHTTTCIHLYIYVYVCVCVRAWKCIQNYVCTSCIHIYIYTPLLNHLLYAPSAP